MSTPKPTVESLLQEISHVPPQDRGRLLDILLLQELGDPPKATTDEAWLAEIHRRIANPGPTVKWDTARQHMFRAQ